MLAKSPMRSLNELSVTEVPSTPYFPSTAERAWGNLNNGDPLACSSQPKTETALVTTNVGDVVGYTNGDSFGIRRHHRCYVVTARAHAFSVPPGSTACRSTEMCRHWRIDGPRRLTNPEVEDSDCSQTYGSCTWSVSCACQI